MKNNVGEAKREAGKKDKERKEERKKGEQRNERAPLNERVMHLRETTPKPKTNKEKHGVSR